MIAKALAEQHPDTNRGWGVRALSFRDMAVDKGTRAVSFVLLGAVAAVLLIGCANLANLTLARGVARQRELAVRASLGASRGRLAREMLAETVLLCLCGGLLGLVLGRWFVELSVASWPEELPYWVNFDLDWRGLAFVVGVASLAALFTGLLPAWRAARPDLAADLRDGARGTAGAASQRLQSAAGRGTGGPVSRTAGGGGPDDAQLPAAAGGSLGLPRAVAAHAALLRGGRRLRPDRAAGRLRARARGAGPRAAGRGVGGGHLQHPDRRRRRSGPARDRAPAGGARRRAGRDPHHRVAAALRDARRSPARRPLLHARRARLPRGGRRGRQPRARAALLARRRDRPAARARRRGRAARRRARTVAARGGGGSRPAVRGVRRGDGGVAPQRVPAVRDRARPLARAAGTHEDAVAARSGRRRAARVPRRRRRPVDLGRADDGRGARVHDLGAAFLRAPDGGLRRPGVAARVPGGLRRAGLRREPADPRDRRANGARSAAVRRRRTRRSTRPAAGRGGRRPRAAAVARSRPARFRACSTESPRTTPRRSRPRPARCCSS